MTTTLEANDMERARRLPKWEEIVTVAVIDAFGIVLTIVAAVVLAVIEHAAAGWWVLVGLAALLSVVSTVVLVRLVARRQKFMADAKRVVARLNEVFRQAEERPPSEKSPPPSYPSPQFVGFARGLRAEALANGEVAIASRLDAAIEHYRNFGESR